MKIKKITTLISILLIIALGLIIPKKMKAAKSPVTYHIEAQASDSFVESMEIAIKYSFATVFFLIN